jgi:dTDP-4-dehydrorhamnose reductase
VFSATMRVNTPNLFGYIMCSPSIDEADLPTLVALTYGNIADISAGNQFQADRSMGATRFRLAINIEAPLWPALVRRMHEFDNANIY